MTLLPVYPGYLAHRLRRALNELDSPIVATVGLIERVGDAHDRIIVTDYNGTRYRIDIRTLRKD